MPDTYFSDYLLKTDERALHKFEHYMPIYDNLMLPWKNQPTTFLEIGVFKGGSMRMWRDYFAPGSKVSFLDIDPACKALELPDTQVFIGDQADTALLAQIALERGPFDIVVDDGGHQSHQQTGSFQALWRQIKNGGLYIVEDVHTSYWPGFGGGYRNPQSFMEYSKHLLDEMHSWYSEDQKQFPLSSKAWEIGSVTFHDSMIIFKKQAKAEWPTAIVSENGRVQRNRHYSQVRDKRSIFQSQPGTASHTKT
ncbi:class I SAM-dependent methyltransferase [Aureimonas fodinaquatilis]|uniref:Class I SAM-dependent methyltransferase n=1 Tax=Aureimonas fodinaquatilis TaxID=2565783 RepID=A0A5B0DN32_9HYPH|nr:class I SAM-dependent methyltransferase [Aureimonas fodinaquatilis]KAA0968277.1 class I SAM-dependent methyltransferase [Aureimonas fodinaquatilis]